MNILVTGATGFIGRRLSAELAAAGGNRVYGLLRSSSSPDRLPPGVEPVFWQGTERLTQAMAGLDIEGIIHLAGCFVAAHKPSDIDSLIDGNIRFGTHVVESAVQAGVRWFVNTSTCWQHYDNQPYNPVALYAATKQAFEDILRYYHETSSLRIISLELTDTYGPGDDRPKLFSLLMKAFDSGEQLAMSPGEQLLSLVYIDDVLSAFRLAMENVSDPSKSLDWKYDLFSGKRYTLREVVRIFSAIFGKDLPVLWGGRPYRPREVMRPCPLYPPVPGWQERTTLEQGIRQLYEAYRKKEALKEVRRGI